MRHVADNLGGRAQKLDLRDRDRHKLRLAPVAGDQAGVGFETSIPGLFPFWETGQSWPTHVGAACIKQRGQRHQGRKSKSCATQKLALPTLALRAPCDRELMRRVYSVHREQRGAREKEHDMLLRTRDHFLLGVAKL